MTTLVLTMIAADRPGLVDALAGVVRAHGGSWQRSHLAHLAGRFAGIVVVDLPEGGAADLIADLEPLRDQGVLDVRAEEALDTSTDRPGTRFTLELVGHDRPGIVHEVAGVLARQGVSIEDLHTSTDSAPMSGEPIFRAEAVLLAPDDLVADDLRAALEALATELMVDLDLALDEQA